MFRMAGSSSTSRTHAGWRRALMSWSASPDARSPTAPSLLASMLIDWPIALMAPQIARFAGRLAIRSRDFGNINLEDSCVSRRAAPDYEFAACAAARSPMTTHDFTTELCRHARPEVVVE